jgi:hypothetical protein
VLARNGSLLWSCCCNSPNTSIAGVLRMPSMLASLLVTVLQWRQYARMTQDKNLNTAAVSACA